MQRRDLRKAGLICGGLAAAVIAAGVLMAMIAPPPTDPATGCPVGDAAPPAHTIILLDATDSLGPTELQFARSLIRTEYAWLPLGGRLTVRNITADRTDAEDITVCRMRDAGSVLGLAVNPRKLQADFDRLAGAQLAALLEGLAFAEPQEASPILEAAAEVMDRPDFGRNVEQRRMVIHSDFAQHSDLASHYGRNEDEPGEDVQDRLWREMRGVEIRLQYIPRPELNEIQGRRHRAFWKRWFEAMGAQADIGHDLLLGEDAARVTIIDHSTAGEAT